MKKWIVRVVTVLMLVGSLAVGPLQTVMASETNSSDALIKESLAEDSKGADFEENVDLEGDSAVSATDALTEETPAVSEDVSSTSDALAGADASGTCGENLTWELWDGNLEIHGTGAITSAPWNKDEVLEIWMEDGITSVCAGAFADCVNLTYIMFSDGIRDIGARAFANCRGLRSLYLPDELKAIGDEAFAGCSAIEYIIFPDGLETIGKRVFANCVMLEEVHIYEGVKLIGEGAFDGCTSLEEVYAPEGVNWTDPPTYTVRFMGNGATGGSMKPMTVYLTRRTALTSNVYTRDGYVFDGWSREADDWGYEYRDGEKVVDLTNKPGDSVTLYAVWEREGYRINYILNGGYDYTSNPYYYTVESETITLQSPEREGYEFVGWYTESSFANKLTSIPKGSFGNLTLYAKWKKVKYIITYKLGGGTNHTKNPAAYYITSADITLQKPTRKGYTFVGWFLDSGYKSEISGIAEGSTGNVTLYAKWKKTKYTIMYKLNGGTNNSKNPKAYYITSADITLKSPTRKGCKFAGWFSDSKFTTKVTTIPKGSTGKMTLYARWTKLKYMITYKLNGGKNNTSNPKSYTVTDKVTLKNPTRTGYVFRGWYKEASFKTKVTAIAKGSTGKRTLYAKWALNRADNKLPRDAASYKNNEVTLQSDKLYYEGSALVLEMIFCNRKHSYVEKLNTITISVYDSKGNLIVSNQSFSNVAVGLSRDGIKTLKFTLKNAPVKDITDPAVDWSCSYRYRQ